MTDVVHTGAPIAKTTSKPTHTHADNEKHPGRERKRQRHSNYYSPPHFWDERQAMYDGAVVARGILQSLTELRDHHVCS